jgi:hypothetical protein
VNKRDVAKGFFKINTDVARMGLGMRALAVYMGLASYVFDQDGTQQCHPGIETLAQGLGVNRKTVERGLDELKKAGLISVQNRSVRGKKTSSVYTLLNVDSAYAAQVSTVNESHSSTVNESYGKEPVRYSSPVSTVFQSTQYGIPVQLVRYSSPFSTVNESHKEEIEEEIETEFGNRAWKQRGEDDSTFQEQSALMSNHDLAVGRVEYTEVLPEESADLSEDILAEECIEAEERLCGSSTTPLVPPTPPPHPDESEMSDLPIPYCKCDDHSNWGSCDHQWSKEQWSRFWEKRAEAEKVPTVRAVFTPPPGWKSKRSRALQST